jgi:hypothetical protein
MSDRQKIKIKIHKNNSSQGVSIIGVLIATIIIALSLTAGLATLGHLTKMSSIARHEITASFLAEEGIELMKNIRDTGDYYCSFGVHHSICYLCSTGNPSCPIINPCSLIMPTDPYDGFARLKHVANTHQVVSPDAYIATDTSFTDLFASTAAPLGTPSSNNNIGLCKRLNAGVFERYQTCNISAANREFLRRIEVLPSTDTTGRYDCQSVNNSEGLKVISTVYWSENWETDWPATAADPSLTNPTATNLHKVSATACLYDWRPR